MSLCVYSDMLSIRHERFTAVLEDHRIVTTLCPGGKERMSRLMELVRHRRLDTIPLLTHTFRLDQIKETYKLVGERRGGVIKVAIKPCLSEYPGSTRCKLFGQVVIHVTW